MIYSLYRLRHHSVISCNYKYCNVCCLRTTHTHCCKCLVPGRVKEGYRLAVNLNHIGTYVLCYTAGLFSADICFSYCIKKGCFSVIDMSHYHHYRRSWNQCAFIIIFLSQKFTYYIHLLFHCTYNIIFQSYFFSLFKAEFSI